MIVVASWKNTFSHAYWTGGLSADVKECLLARISTMVRSFPALVESDGYTQRTHGLEGEICDW
jgi:hypothetical protein